MEQFDKLTTISNTLIWEANRESRWGKENISGRVTGVKIITLIFHIKISSYYTRSGLVPNTEMCIIIITSSYILDISGDGAGVTTIIFPQTGPP